MQKIIILTLSLVLAGQVSAWTLYDQLCYFNFNWEKYEHLAPEAKAIVLKSDQEYVGTHLSYVIPILKANSTGHLNERQYRTRLQLIETLEEYRKTGKFPVNHFCQERTPVFIDANGTHCAVGYLLQQSGYDEVAQRISENENYAWVKDIHDPAIPILQEASGFSLEEIKLIQGAYDSYLPGAFFAPNKYELPQKPEVIVAYFEKNGKKDERAIWCKGEGKNGVLHGAWIQNYTSELPWIVGYYENGKRTGQWMEYYQGTKKLCRTENWRNDKLNGVRTRFNMDGEIIEEIVFKNGNAVLKTNYDIEGGLKWVRKPLDSINLYSELYSAGGALICAGKERIDNPGNLSWFQDIELTALNTMAITSRDVTSSSTIQPNGFQLYNSPQLVQYKKEGEWIYFPEYVLGKDENDSLSHQLVTYFPHFDTKLVAMISKYGDVATNSTLDSVGVRYTNDHPEHLFGYGEKDYVHLAMTYHEAALIAYIPFHFRGYTSPQRQRVLQPLKTIGRYTKQMERVDEWKHFSHNGQITKIENYLIPWKESQDEHNTANFEKSKAVKPSTQNTREITTLYATQ